MSLVGNMVLDIKNLSYSDHPHPFPMKLFHFKDSILRKCSEFEKINLKTFIIELFKVSTWKQSKYPQWKSTTVEHFLNWPW